MRIAPLAILAAVVCTTAASASEVRILDLPDSVRGAWAPSDDACKGSAPGKVDIAAKMHTAANASCTIAWITVTPSRDGPVYSARSVCTRSSGEKEPASYLVVTPLSDDKLLVRMPDASLEGRLVTYRKCS